MAMDCSMVLGLLIARLTVNRCILPSTAASVTTDRVYVPLAGLLYTVQLSDTPSALVSVSIRPPLMMFSGSDRYWVSSSALGTTEADRVFHSASPIAWCPACDGWMPSPTS